MTNASTPELYIGKNAVDAQGNKIGSVGQVYLNDQTGEPDWITVNTGLFGMRESFAPLQGSSFNGENLVLPFDKAVVKDAPDVADSSHLDGDEQEHLYSYYQQYLVECRWSRFGCVLPDWHGRRGRRGLREPGQRPRIRTRAAGLSVTTPRVPPLMTR